MSALLQPRSRSGADAARSSKHEGVIEGKEKEMGEVRTKVRTRRGADRGPLARS